MKSIKAVPVRTTAVALPFSMDVLSEVARDRVRQALSLVAQEELTAFLGAGIYARTETCRGYRNGTKTRTLTTSFGPTELVVPRALVFDGERHREWQSQIVPRYARRTREVDAALLGLYFGGVNTRRVKQAIRPLLKNSPLSKSSISRVIVQLQAYFENWSQRNLSREDIRYMYLDATFMPVRCGGKTERLPIMVAIGVRGTGEKVLLSLAVMGVESTAAWSGFVTDLADRGLKRMELAIVDGNKGLTRALLELWPNLPIQRCTVHKLWNLLGHAPKSLQGEVKADYDAIINADGIEQAKAAYGAFMRKWSRKAESVARSLEDAGMDLLTFMRFPKKQWRSLKTTNIVERLNLEFRRRTKTQGVFPTQSSVLVLLFGLVASGMVRMRKIGGYETMQTGVPSVEAVSLKALAVA
ncbi:MAG: IS256 family transposase [Elusimicrobia bacterium]|nr:IS256 family transposase [Elusimicrobiota bacterium]